MFACYVGTFGIGNICSITSQVLAVVEFALLFYFVMLLILKIQYLVCFICFLIFEKCAMYVTAKPETYVIVKADARAHIYVVVSDDNKHFSLF